MEAYFLDVAQGTCQIILLGNATAIVLDCGPSTDQLALRFLKHMGIQTIARLVISHSHSDHIGGAVSILGEYQGRIEQVWFVQDDMFLETRLWLRIQDLYKKGIFTKDSLRRLEYQEKEQVVWADGQTTLAVYSPSTATNLLAQDQGTPNPTSAVLFLETGSTRLVFSSDSEVDQWRDIYQKAGPISCDLLAVPHHAGKSHDTNADLQWMYGTAIEARVAVVSVGTSNTHKHPRPDVIQALRASGAEVLCTQITKQCSTQLETLRPAVLKPVTHLGRSNAVTDLTDAGNSRNVGCAGTVLATISQSGVVVDRVASHQLAVDNLKNSGVGCPLCRP